MGIIRVRRSRNPHSFITLSAESAIAAYVEELRQALKTGVRTRRRIVREVENHLLDAVSANENRLPTNSTIDAFGNPKELAEHFNALAKEARRRLRVRLAAACVAATLGCTLIVKDRTPESTRTAPPTSSTFNFVKLDPQTGRTLTTSYELVSLDPHTGRVLAVVHR